MSSVYERAIERWIENFIEDHGREPTDDEIDAAEEEAVENYLCSEADSVYESMRDQEMGL